MINKKKEGREPVFRMPEGEDNYRMLVEQSSEGIVIAQGDKVQFANHGICAIIGRTEEEIYSKSFLEFVHPDFHQKIKQEFQERLSGKKKLNKYPFKVLCKNGQSKWLKASSVQIEWKGQPASLVTLMDITQLKNSEEALKASQANLEALINNMEEAVCTKDLNRNLVSWNKRYDESLKVLFGVGARVGLNTWELVKKRNPDSPNLFKLLERVHRGETIKTQFDFPFPDGNTYNFEIFYSPIKKDDSIIGHIEVIRNITNQKEVDNKIKKAEQLYRTMVDFTYDWEYWRSPEGKFIYMSPSCERITGYSREEFLDDPGLFQKIIHKDYRELWNKHKKEDSSKAHGLQIPIKTRTGKTCWIEHICQPVTGEKGESLGRRASNRDITIRKQMEDSLIKTEENLNRAQAVSHIGSWYLDLLIGKLNWSDETYRIFGLSPETDISYDKFMEIIHPFDKEHVNNSWLMAMKGKPYDIQHRILVKGEVKWVRERAKLEFSPEGEAIAGIGTAQDITEMKTREAERQQLREQLAHTGRVASLGELTAAMAHEINQPLTAIMNNTLAGIRFLKIEDPDLQEIKEIFTDILSDNQRAAAIIRNLRGLMKKQPENRTNVQINDIIEEVVSLINSDRIIRNIDLDLQLQPDLPTIFADRIQLQQVILNLIINGFEAMVDLPKERSRLVISNLVDHKTKTLTIMVRDYGVGLATGRLSEIFDPFHSTKETGMGIGLAINRTIIEAHGGKIRAIKNPDFGLTISFTLPIVEIEKK